MAKCEVVKIKNGEGTCLINKADFDADKHELADAPKEEKTDAAPDKEEAPKEAKPEEAPKEAKKSASKKAPANPRRNSKKAD